MMRERSLGNSCTQLYRKLVEQHHLAWMQRGIDYMSVCEAFAARQPDLVVPEIPQQPERPKPRWLTSVNLCDAMSRVEDVKAKLTSTFSSVLKLDSTKKLTKKLAGESAQTAQWVTDVVNKHGQVLTCVLTTAESAGLEEMGRGLVCWYRELTSTRRRCSTWLDQQLAGFSADGRIFRCAWTSGTDASFRQRRHRGQPPAVRRFHVATVSLHLRVGFGRYRQAVPSQSRRGELRRVCGTASTDPQGTGTPLSSSDSQHRGHHRPHQPAAREPQR